MLDQCLDKLNITVAKVTFRSSHQKSSFYGNERKM